MRSPTWILAALVLVAPSLARADPPRGVTELPWDAAVDAPLVTFAGVAWIISELEKPSLAPASCRWCGVDAFDASARRALVWSKPALASTLSDVAVFGLAPVSAIGLNALAAWHDGHPENLGEDALIVLEASFLAMDVDQAVKYAAGRPRPYAHFANAAVLSAHPDPHDANLSFFSGHTTAAFAFAVSSGTVASMRGYRWAPWVWAQGLGIAVGSGYLRLAADRHYVTDVLAGAAVAAAMGWAVPWLLHRPGRGERRASIAVVPMNGAGLGVVGLW